MLGFRKTADHVFGNDDEVYLDIRQAEKVDQQYERFAPGLNHIGFTAANSDVISKIQEKMKSAGYDVPEIQVFGEDIAIFLKDPDGIRIEVGVLG